MRITQTLLSSRPRLYSPRNLDTHTILPSCQVEHRRQFFEKAFWVTSESGHLGENLEKVLASWLFSFGSTQETMDFLWIALSKFKRLHLRMGQQTSVSILKKMKQRNKSNTRILIPFTIIIFVGWMPWAKGAVCPPTLVFCSLAAGIFLAEGLKDQLAHVTWVLDSLKN